MQVRARKQAVNWSAGGILVLLVAGLIYLALEADLLDDLAGLHLRHLFGSGLRQYGAPALLPLLYVEESGLPLPVPGDVYVAVLGDRAAHSTPAWAWLAGTWLAIVVVVSAGATNLFLLSRRFGRRLVEHRLARAFHLDPERVERVEGWFRRWGVLAVVFGRHIPGFRVPLTVAAGSLGFPFRLFLPSVAVSTGLWAGLFVYLGARYGHGFRHFADHHHWIYAAGTVFFVAAVAYLGFRLAREAART